MKQNQPKVLFVIGYARSGTTILGKLLNEIDGFFCGGELRELWSKALPESRSKCGCGTPLNNCKLWLEVLQAWLSRHGIGMLKDIAQVASLQDRVLRWHNLLRILTGAWKPGSRQTDLDSYVESTERLYHAIHKVTGDTVIVDTSKGSVVFTALMARAPGINPYFLHVVRDPRGVIFSRQRSRERRLEDHRHPRPGAAKLGKLILIQDALSWVVMNLMTKFILRRLAAKNSLSITYEDFVANPRATLEKVAALVDEPLEELSFLNGNTAVLGENHIAFGNTNRKDTGPVDLREDLAWVSHLTNIERRMVEILTSPLSGQYGYKSSKVYQSYPQTVD